MKMIIALLAAMLILIAAVPYVQAATQAVSMKNTAFVPREITIATGDTVTWTNNDPIPHDVDLGSLGESPVMNKGATYSKTFDKPGTYSYICNIHPSMKGTVIVR